MCDVVMLEDWSVGSGKAAFEDGVDQFASFNQPTGICVDRFGAVYVADWYFCNLIVRELRCAYSAVHVQDEQLRAQINPASCAVRYCFHRRTLTRTDVIALGRTLLYR